MPERKSMRAGLFRVLQIQSDQRPPRLPMIGWSGWKKSSLALRMSSPATWNAPSELGTALGDHPPCHISWSMKVSLDIVWQVVLEPG